MGMLDSIDGVSGRLSGMLAGAFEEIITNENQNPMELHFKRDGLPPNLL